MVDDILRRWVEDPAVLATVRAQLRAGAAGRTAERRLTFRAIREEQPGPRMRAVFRDYWPSYRRWYLRQGEDARPTLAQAHGALRAHMPELVPVWSRVVEAVGADELGARMLSMYDPPPLVSGCSQAALAGDPALVRNYDYDVELFDGVVLDTRLTARRVIGTADQLWGLLDGINDAGLAASLTFGGRPDVGRGFSIPIVIRYLLETCADVEEAVSALHRLPVQAAYNITLVDPSGNHGTVLLGPDRPLRMTCARVTTNHQGEVEWPAHARWTRTVERLQRLEEVVESGPATVEDVVAAMLSFPLRSAAFDEGFATLYTAVYRPGEGSVEYRWPGSSWRQSFADFREGTHEVAVADGVEPAWLAQ